MWKKSSLDRKNNIEGLFFALPAILGFGIWLVGPMVFSLIISFTEWEVVGAPRFIGLANYSEMIFEDDLFRKSLGVTLYYMAGSLPLVLIAAFSIAILLNQKVKGITWFRAILYLPSLLPLIASSYLWLWLFNPDFGLLNATLARLGLPTSMWIFGERTAIPSLILMAIWGMGGTMIIFLAGLQHIPAQLYEAAEIDGANWWKKFRHITIPQMSPIIFFNLIIMMIGTFQIFVQPFAMTQGGPHNATLFYMYHIWRVAFNHYRFGYACSLSWILFLSILVVSLVIFKSSPFWVYYEGKTK